MKRFRFWVMGVASVAVAALYLVADPDGGRQFAEQLRALVGVVFALPLVYLARRALAESVRGRDLAELVRDGNVAAGLAYLGLRVLEVGLLLVICGRAPAAELPAGAVQYLPVLQSEVSARWPSMPAPSMLAALVEQESGWRERATLHTSREDGVGLGQFTRAYGADGRLRFDALAEVSRLDPSLAAWSWADRYNPRMQLRAVVVKVRTCHARLSRLVRDDYNALAMCDAAYNGGEGGVMAERRLCAQAPGCDPGVWFGNVEAHSTKSRARWHGYGASAFEINRGHVQNVMIVRRAKYVAALGA
ncbi:hypothetical protein GCM10007933_02270 [Zoogloea oryzae]|uniref:Transglycosylase SLT domain-containing protein n=1 Tax=Zoogloea oryzae TaxID=310767 RepID=A0ABQ6F7E5_9RHOO|nr:hypothetical protein [Zoogloea oryzae]GLT20775.1 hypothetical protein GCM10007933_02270 [Zoogloea oryzae]